MDAGKYFVMFKQVLINSCLYPLRWAPSRSEFFGPPRYIKSSAWDYYKKLADVEKKDNPYYRLSPEQEVSRRMPMYADPPIKRLFAKMKKGVVKERFVVNYNQGRYWGRGYGYIITRDDTLIHDLSPTFYDYGSPHFPLWLHDGLSRPKLPNMGKVYGKVVVLNTFFCSNFHHWLIDTLPKIQLLKEAGIPLERVGRFVFDYQKTAYQDEALKLLGIPLKKIIPSAQKLHIQADELIIPSYSEPGAHPDWYNYTPEGMDFVNRLFLGDEKVDAPIEPFRHLLVSRNKAQCRRWVEEEDAWIVLAKRGFERICMEDFSVQEQARIFNEAKTVVMPHGGGLANCVFCQPGTKIIEMFHPRYLPTFMMTLCDNRKIDYCALVGRDVNCEIKNGGLCDISVDPERVLEYL